MGSLFQWPFKRKTYPGLNNPRFVSDIQAANENTLDGLMNLAGLGATDFFLFAGFAFTPGTPGTYGPGVFFLNGSFYYSAGLTEGQAVQAAPVDTLTEPFGDGVGRNIYTLLQSSNANAVTPGTTSVLFAGDMNAYRIDNKTLAVMIAAINATLARLGGAAFLNTGQTPGTVAAGDDNRFGYSSAYQDANFARIANVLIKGSTNGNFVPTQPFDPATKSYADSLNPKRLASGNTPIGDIPQGGFTINVSFGTTLANNNYLILITGISLGVPSSDATSHWPAVFNKTTTGCSVRFQEGVGITQDLSMDWIVFGF